MSDFAPNIAQYVQLYAKAFGIQVVSPIVAQAILETGNGVDVNAQVKVANHNVFGMKYSKNDPERVKSFSHFFADGGWEVVDGTREELDPNTSYWYGFADIEQCVIGYFEFIQKTWYAPLKECTTAKEYCHAIKECGYATDPDYPSKLLSIIERYELSQYDIIESEEKKMSNLNLVSYTNISPNKTSPRNAGIDTITIHCVVGQWTGQKIADYFADSSVKASCNYGVGTDGKVSLVVEEKDRSWCSSSASNDNRAVTIEVASDTTSPYVVNDVAYAKLIELVADICKRNNIMELKWQGDSSLVGQVDKQNMTVHRWFAAKACPGDFLYNKHGEIASKVNAMLSGEALSGEQTSEAILYRVQVGAYKVKENAESTLLKLKANGFDGFVKEVNGLYKVQVGAFAVKSNAETRMKGLEQSGFDAFITQS